MKVKTRPPLPRRRLMTGSLGPAAACCSCCILRCIVRPCPRRIPRRARRESRALVERAGQRRWPRWPRVSGGASRAS